MEELVGFDYVSFTVSFWSLGFPQKFQRCTHEDQSRDGEVWRLQATGGAEATPLAALAVSATG
jgi:hypothetical protein